MLQMCSDVMKSLWQAGKDWGKQNRQLSSIESKRAESSAQSLSC